MKTLFVSLVAFLFAFIIGCQESSITDPVSNDTELSLGTEVPLSVDKDLISYYPGVIKLVGTLLDPSHYFNSMAEIKGIVRYRLEQVDTYDNRPPRSAIKVQLYVKAEIVGGHTGRNSPWTVNETSSDFVYTSPAVQSVYNLEKSFRVRNTCCAPLNLVLKFQVNKKAISLVSMALKIARYPDWLPIQNNEM